MSRYNPKEIEPKWQKIWDETGAYTADLNSKKPKYIAMSMFNYPSGAGIHIGHAMNYTISDVKSRFKRQQGYESYHPVGWDAFGLPAENYAIKSGVSPQESMANIIPGYHRQYKAMGWSNDWEKEIATHLPEYYKWTQWIFVKMFENGLAYQDSRMQWWCAIDNTVLANEQVIDGKCWRHDGADDPMAEKREIRQWFFKITEYADELLEATDSLDWTESVKLSQKNWIGKSEGLEVEFKIDGSENKLKVFTTAHDTIYGTTFMVVAPEHELVSSLTTSDQTEPIKAYVNSTAKKSEVERQADKQKTGVFTGSYALHPLTGKKLPIWVADYVLVGYGTGAIMAVPGEDERDYDFAKVFGLDIIYTTEQQEFIEYSDIKAAPTKFKLANSSEFDGLDFKEGRAMIQDKLISLKAGFPKINYKMRDWSVSRQRYWGAPIPIIHCQDCGPQIISETDLPVILPELVDFQPSGDGRSALARATDWLVADCPKCGNPAERETDTLDTYMCSSWYMFRYLDPHNQQQIFDSNIVNEWAPIDFYNGADHATAHLLYARFVARFFSKIGLINNPEPFKQMLFNGKVKASDGTSFSKSKGNGIDPLEIINSGYGADALRTYLMFASPLELDARWDPQGVPGSYRFLSRIWSLVTEYLDPTLTEEISKETAESVLRTTHKMIKKVSEDIEISHYNTAIASMMECTNDLYKLKSEGFTKCDAWDEALKSIVACVAPFAPHMSEELWLLMGHSLSINHDSWPVLNVEYLKTSNVKVVVQVNGKLRGDVEIEVGTSQDQVESAAKALPRVTTQLTDHDIKKVIYVPNKLINFVV